MLKTKEFRKKFRFNVGFPGYSENQKKCSRSRSQRQRRFGFLGETSRGSRGEVDQGEELPELFALGVCFRV